MVRLNLNDKQGSNGKPEWAINANMPWIIDDIEDKIQTNLDMNQLTSIYIEYLWAKSSVANELLDLLTCYDLAEHGL